ncbi:hypothetical protein Glove_350g112 [Diversispora epigaea]|uniref:Uncharacterized protein n=1 Tax=Diversispora epigaea TaxID=1348612 RepID=A0A397HHD8_9GLOM|nr:hypothetical protein Glove_350g112 [Diversispora epigaea]
MGSIVAKRGWDHEDSTGVNERVLRCGKTQLVQSVNCWENFTLNYIFDEMGSIVAKRGWDHEDSTGVNERVLNRVGQLLHVQYLTKQDQIDICNVISQRMAMDQDETNFDKSTDEFTNNNNVILITIVILDLVRRILKFCENLYSPH